MTFLLDTDVVSEWVKPRPDAQVMSWIAGVDEDRVFLSVVTVAELRRGIGRLTEGSRRRRLDEWLRIALPLRFESRILHIDDKVAEEWGRIVARREASARQIGAMDAFIAATATVHDLALVTRNVDDFRPSLGAIVNPWSS